MLSRACAATVFSIVLASCSRPAEAPIQRVAVLRFENLTADRSLDWMGRAASEVVGAEISAGHDVYVIPAAAIHGLDPVTGSRPLTAPGVSSESTQARLAGATRLIYGYISLVEGKVRIAASEEEIATRKIVKSASGAGTDLSTAADQLARGLSSEVRPFSTHNQQALQNYALALEAQPAEAEQDYARAVAADPNFGAAYVNWLRLAQARQDRGAFEKILGQARSRGNSIPPLDRAYLDIEALSLGPSAPAGIAALSAAARLSPNDPAILQALANAELATPHYPEAIRYYRAALRSAPGDVELWNTLGYALMFSGDYAGAIQSIGEYQRQRPNDANPLDSLGDVNFYFGNFGEAEKLYLQAFAKSNQSVEADLIKAAHARLMTGDIAGANGIFARYQQGKDSRDAAAAFRVAEWQYLTGRRKEAEAILGQLATVPVPAVRSAAEAQLAIWKLQDGDRVSARDHAARAASAQPSDLTALAGYVCEAPGRVEFTGPRAAALRRLALGYSLLFAQQFAEAAPVWKEIAGSAGPSEHPLPVLYAWTLVETDRAKEAAPFLRWNPLPQPNNGPGFGSLIYPRIFYLRGVVLEKQGNAAEARRNFKLFVPLMGNEDDIFGDRKRAVARGL